MMKEIFKEFDVISEDTYGLDFGLIPENIVNHNSINISDGDTFGIKGYNYPSITFVFVDNPIQGRGFKIVSNNAKHYVDKNTLESIKLINWREYDKQ